MTASQALGKIIYEEAAKEAAGQQPAGAEAPGGDEKGEPAATAAGKKDDDVIDAEFEVKE